MGDIEKKERKPKGYWNYDTCYAAAKECTSRSDFKKKYQRGYEVAYQNGWLDNYIWFKELHKPNGYWNNYDHCYNAAKECKTRSEFSKKYPRAYKHSIDNNWIDYFVWLERQTNNYVDKVHCVYCYLFTEQKTIYIGRTNNRTRRHRHHSNDDCPVKRFADNHNTIVPEMTIIEDYLTLEESLIYEDLYLEQYKNNGWNMINKGKTGLTSGSIGACAKKWTFKKCYNIAITCKTKQEFRKKNFNAYHASINNNWIDKFTWFIDGHKLSGEKRLNNQNSSKKIIQYTVDGKFIREWPSTHEIERECGYSRCNIVNCCNHKARHKTSYGSRWEWAA